MNIGVNMWNIVLNFRPEDETNTKPYGYSMVHTETIDAVPLNRAVLCADCDCITASTGNCLMCGSTALINLAKVINRSEKESKQ